MAVTAHQDKDVWVLRITGTLLKSEMDGLQTAGAKEFQAGGTVKLLLVAENFDGWERGADWGDMSFFLEHGDKIDKIAIVADPKRKAEWLAFAGAGFRRAPVQYFPLDQLAQARAWLA